MKHILIVDDDIHINKMLDEVLVHERYMVSHAYSGTEALLFLADTKPDLILLDLMLPGLSGEELLPQISDIPIIVMSAKVDVEDKVSLLLGGAVDYVTKPFSVMELMARVRSQLRRTEEDTVNYKEIGCLKINTDTREVFVNDKLVVLTFKEYELLIYLIDNTHRVVTRDELLNKIWGYEYTGETRTIDIHIRTLRQKISPAGEYIKTVRGMGYRMSKD